MASVMSAMTGRRLQRSVRMTVAIALLSVATAVALVAAGSAAVPVLTSALVLSLACGWGALRIVHVELVQTRRDAARERATEARRVASLLGHRAREHAVVVERLADRGREVRELEATLRLSERRAVDAELRARLEARRASEATERVAELEDALSIRRAEEADELASWSAYADADTVVDLMSWEDRGSTRTDRRARVKHA